MSSKNEWKDKSTRDLKEELDKKLDEKKKIVEIIGRRRKRKGLEKKIHLFYEGEIHSLNPEGVLIIEESGWPQGYVDLYFYYGKGKALDFSIKLEESEANKLGVTKFLEEEVNSVESHDHESGIRHRVWKLTGREMEIAKELWHYHSLLGERYRNGGWDEVKKTLDKLKKVSEDSIVLASSARNSFISDHKLALGAEKKELQDIVSRWERILNQRSTSRGDSHA